MQFETDFHATGERPRVFVIESEEVVRSALHYILRAHYQTGAFAHVADALAAAVEVPDVVLLGAALLQGKEDAFLAELGEQFAGAKILVVADRNSDPQGWIERGAHGILSKPISFDAVCGAVEAALAAPVLAGEPSRLIRVAFG